MYLYQHFAHCSMEDSVVSRVKTYIADEVLIALRDQQTSLSSQLIEAMRSSAVTPIANMTPDPQVQQTHVLQLLRQGQLNTAFQQVSTQKSNIYMYTAFS